MENLLRAAIDKEKNQEYSFFLDGDLNQMSVQRSFLNKHGIETKQNNVYPCLKEEDVSKSLKLIWEFEVDGWWHYKKEYVKYNICTEEEFINRLNQ